jgi:hypothetical protein
VHVSLMERSLFLCRRHLFLRERDLDGMGQSERKWGGSRDQRGGGERERESRKFTEAEPTTIPTHAAGNLER